MSFRIWIENNQRFYHGTKMKFPIGFILKPQPTGYVYENKEIEDFLEKYRPPHLLSRKHSVFIVSNPDEIDYAGGYEDFIYEVQPMGQIDKSDLAWYSEAESNLFDGNDINQAAEDAKNYWAGIPFKNAKNSLFEYRTPQAKILRLI